MYLKKLYILLSFVFNFMKINFVFIQEDSESLVRKHFCSCWTNCIDFS